MATFTETKYQTDAGTVVRIRVSDDAIAAAGQVIPAGAVTDKALWAFAGNPGSRRKRQLNARGVVLGREVGTDPNTFTRRTFLPIMTKAALDAIAIGAAVTIGGEAYTVRAAINEA